MVRAKFKVQTVEHYEGAYRRVKLQAVSDDGIPENKRYHKYTPNGTIELSIDNPPASDVFAPGMSFYVDFTAVNDK